MPPRVKKPAISTDQDARWRPKDRRGPRCGYTLRGKTCTRRGAHYCALRADRVVLFFSELLVHTRGPMARTAFRLEDWQEHEIIRPIFGEVIWSADHKRYVRRYRVAHIIVARKNGKALGVATPVLSEKRWTTMGELSPGDRVHAPSGELTTVTGVSERWSQPCYRVSFADGASLVANGAHRWTVKDRAGHRVTVRTIDTDELFLTRTYGARGDNRYTVDVPGPLDRADQSLPLEPYVLGAWLGDGSATKAEITSPDAEIIDSFRRAGFPSSYVYDKPGCLTIGFLGGFLAVLQSMNLRSNKHIPADYLLASAGQRLALLQGLMDTDGAVNACSHAPRVEFCNTNRDLAEGVLFLARSLGWKATIKESRATLYGKDCGPRWRVCWTAYRDRPPFRLARQISKLAPAPVKPTRASTNSIVGVEKVPTVETVCIEVDDPSHQFLAGSALTPTHNSELAAGIQLYMLVGDDEEASEVFSAAKDTKQAGKVFEPAQRMVELSPVLSSRIRHYRQSRRLVDQQTASVYEIITADAKGELGHNPHSFNLDELLAAADGSMWQAMVTAAGARAQELLYTTSTETNDSASFGATMIDEAERVQEDPSRSPHTFAFVRKLPSTLDGLERLQRVFPGHPHLPVSIDPFDEANWKWPNPGLDQFKSRDAMRRQALEAVDNVENENGFRQFQTNQRVQQISRFISLALWDENVGPELAPTADWWRPKLTGQLCWAGMDLSSKLDMTAWCLLFEDGQVLWRYWIPESVVPIISAETGGQMERWIRDGWVVATDGDTIDYEKIYTDIGADCDDFVIQRVVYDRWSGEPVRQRLELDTGLEFIESGTTFSHMTGPMGETMRLLTAGELAHGGNPVSRWMADNLNAKRPRDDPDRIRPVKPDRAGSGVRIDGMPALFFAVDCRQMTGRYTSAYAIDDPKVAVI